MTVGNLFSIRVSDASHPDRNIVSDGRFTISRPPSIFVHTPMSSSQWTAGQPASVLWSSQGLSGSARIQLYRGTNVVATLSSSIAFNTRSLAVTSSQTSGLVAGTNYKVEVRDATTGAVADESEMFEVLASSPAPPGSINVTKPAGSCQANGSPCAVAWSMLFAGGSAAPGKVRITYSGGSPATTGTVVSEVDATSANYAWSIPSSLAGGSYFVHLISIGITPKVVGTSSQFTIHSIASMMVTKPTTGDTWVMSKPAIVAWIGVNIGESSPSLDSVNMNLIDASGTNVMSLGTNLNSSSVGGRKEGVVVPRSANVPSSDGYKVRVTSTIDSTLTADSQTFSITKAPTLTITSPSFSGSYFRGSMLPIRWTCFGPVSGEVKIEIVDSLNNIVQTIAEPWTTASGKNAFDFEVPPKLTLGFSYNIRITTLDQIFITSNSSLFDIRERPVMNVFTPIKRQSMTLAQSNAIEWSDAAAIVEEEAKVNVVLLRSGEQVHTVAKNTDNDGLEIWYADPTTMKSQQSSLGTGYKAVVESSTESLSSVSKLYAVISNYPGLEQTRMVPGSFATVDSGERTSGGIVWRYGLRFARNGREGKSGGFHVHSGTSCESADAVGGHTDGNKDNPWKTAQWSKDTNMFTMESQLDLPSLSDMMGNLWYLCCGKRFVS